MTREERIAKMAEIRAAVEAKVIAYNEAMLEAKFEEMTKISNETDELVNEYTSQSRRLCFEECAAADDPMIEAVTRLTFPSIAVKDNKKGDDGTIPVREVVDRERQIDLMKLHKEVNGGIGHDKNWHYMLEKLNFIMTAQKAKELGIDPTEINDSYDMTDIAKAYDLGKNPASKTNILKTMTGIVQAMVGEEYKPTSHDVNYLLSIYAKKKNSKALTVTCANHRYMRNYMAEICHRIVTGKTYEVEYKKAK